MTQGFPQLQRYATTLDIEYAGDQPSDVPAPPILTMPFSSKVGGAPGFLHSGAISALLEMAALVAIQAELLRRGRDCKIRQINASIDVMCAGVDSVAFGQGHITRIGSKVANVSANLWQDSPDRIIAQAHMHYLVR